MKLIKSIIAWIMLAGTVHAIVQGFVIAGWQGAGVVLLFLLIFVGTAKALADTLLAPFNRRGD